MIREQVVITPIVIDKIALVKHFQVKLPKNAKRIIGIELGVRWLGGTEGFDVAEAGDAVVGGATGEAMVLGESIELPTAKLFKRNTLIGEVRLQSCEEANIFYAGYLQLDNNIGLKDFSQTKNWLAAPFTHQMNAFEEKIIVDGETTILQGIYKDLHGELSEVPVNYLVSVYVWIEIEEPIRNN